LQVGLSERLIKHAARAIDAFTAARTNAGMRLQITERRRALIYCGVNRFFVDTVTDADDHSAYLRVGESEHCVFAILTE
jgi:hypothetical protein